jgi:uncharacterized protein (TIGR03083 family)
MIHHVKPIEVLHLFPILDRMLIDMLRKLTPEQWNAQTIARKWKVKDVAAHLLDGNLRTISMVRDGHFPEQPANVTTYHDLVIYLNQLNADWTTASKRLSPAVITELLETTGGDYIHTLGTLDPWADAVFAVAWAGEEISRNWFHVAREYTEKWIHQQQIRDAAGLDGLMTKELFYPFIDTFMCALPQVYRYTEAITGTSVMMKINSEIGGEWHINKTEEGWVLRKTTNVQPNAIVEMDPDTAWRLFSKGIMPEEALEKTKITGAEQLGMVALGMVSVMA